MLLALLGVVLCGYSLIDGAQALSACPLITAQGYPCEEHLAKTSDGWNLLLQRIPTGKNASAPKLGVVHLNHGLLDSSAGMVVNDRTESLPFILADAGYDVWLGNNRGNGQSMDNDHYQPSQKEFWDYTFDEMGAIDLPTMIQYELNVTGRSNLTWIGHSQGTMQAFIGFENAAVAAKVNLFVALAPVAYTHHCRSALIDLLADLDGDKIFQLFGIAAFELPAFIQQMLPGVCDVFDPICVGVFDLIMGPTTHLNTTRLPFYLNYFPAATSVKNLAHWAQCVRHQAFEMYDYGKAGNMAHYNQPTPPQYDLGNVKMNVALFSGTNDYLADPTDVQLIRQQLPKGSLVADVVQNGYAHMDFTTAQDAKTLIYPQLLQLLARYNKV